MEKKYILHITFFSICYLCLVLSVLFNTLNINNIRTEIKYMNMKFDNLEKTVVK